MLRVGAMTHRVLVERRISVDSAVGSSEPRWTSMGLRWASIEPLSSRERVAAATAQMLTTHRLRLRFVDGLDESCRISETRHGSTRTFNVHSVLDIDERHVEHEVMATEVKP